jgi:hypothetical protein
MLKSMVERGLIDELVLYSPSQRSGEQKRFWVSKEATESYLGCAPEQVRIK